VTYTLDDVTACIVTRGDVDLQPIRDSLIFPHVIVWDNSRRPDHKTFGRYAAAVEATTPLVYFQDDDVIVSAAAQQGLLERSNPGTVICNMSGDQHLWEYPELTWVGAGAIVDRSTALAAVTGWQRSESFYMVGCDIALSLSRPAERHDLGHAFLDYAHAGNRVHRDGRFADWKSAWYKRGLAHGRSVGVNRTKLNLGCGGFPLVGFHNLDKDFGWTYEDGLVDFDDASVAGITVSHSLMYVQLDDWPAVFAEFARVLAPRGVIRITEDSTQDPASERYGGDRDAVTLTSPQLVADHLAAAGMSLTHVQPDETRFTDTSLIQNLHGAPPKVFHIEGIRV